MRETATQEPPAYIEARKVRDGNSPRSRQYRARHHSIKALDRRSLAGQRVRELMRQFESDLGGNLTDGQRLAVSRAATMAAIAEDARIRRLNGETGTTLDDLVRLDRTAALAIRQLGIRLPAKAAAPTLAEYLRDNPT